MIRAKNAHLSEKCRSDIILWVIANIPRRDIARIMSGGEIEVVGGFDQIPPTSHPGWILRVLSKNGRGYNVAVTFDKKKRELHTWLVSTIPWNKYNGKPNRGFWCVYDGDDPPSYLLQKVRAIRERETKISKA